MSRPSRTASYALAIGAVTAFLPGCSAGAEQSAASVQTTAPPEDDVGPPPIDPLVGFVAHYGPVDRDNPEDVAGYMIAPGAEVVDCAYSKLGNDAAFFYDHYDVWSRPGMHHVILSTASDTVKAGTHDDCSERDHGSSLLAVVQGGIGGSVYHYPPDGEVAPENRGLGTSLAPHQAIAYELHAINSTEEPILRETWTAFYIKPDSEVTTRVGQMAFNGGLAMHVAPNSRQTITNSCQVSDALGSVRIVDLFGHMHSHGQRFSAWVARKGDPPEARTLIYESYDWSLLDLIEFNSVKKNAEISYQGGKPGGFSGDLTLAPGDRIDYECAVNNTETYPLVFAAKAFTGEMCNMFGSFTPGTYWSCLGN